MRLRCISASALAAAGIVQSVDASSLGRRHPHPQQFAKPGIEARNVPAATTQMATHTIYKTVERVASTGSAAATPAVLSSPEIDSMSAAQTAIPSAPSTTAPPMLSETTTTSLTLADPVKSTPSTSNTSSTSLASASTASTPHVTGSMSVLNSTSTASLTSAASTPRATGSMSLLSSTSTASLTFAAYSTASAKPLATQQAAAGRVSLHLDVLSLAAMAMTWAMVA